MKTRLTIPILAVILLLWAGLATGGPLFYMSVILLTLMMATAYFSVYMVCRTLSVQSALSAPQVHRGEDVTVQISVRHGSFLPIAPIQLELTAAPDMPPTMIRLRDMPGKQQKVTMPFHASHIGVSTPGIRRCIISDIFGLFSRQVTPDTQAVTLTVFPNTVPTKPLEFAPGDPGSETMARATEDVSSPSDVRSYQQGDALKKIHWKLSARKGQIMVRRYEEPALSEALILMDCSQPPTWGHPEAAADVRDALLQTAASVVTDLMAQGNGVRLPLLGKHPIQLGKGMTDQAIITNLAMVDFSETDRFERVLLLETRRLRKVGANVVIAARLNGSMVDMMIRMHRMGPTVRMYMITFMPDDPAILPMVSKLNQAGIEVLFVKPQPA